MVVVSFGADPEFVILDREGRYCRAYTTILKVSPDSRLGTFEFKKTPYGTIGRDGYDYIAEIRVKPEFAIEDMLFNLYKCLAEYQVVLGKDYTIFPVSYYNVYPIGAHFHFGLEDYVPFYCRSSVLEDASREWYEKYAVQKARGPRYALDYTYRYYFGNDEEPDRVEIRIFPSAILLDPEATRTVLYKLKDWIDNGRDGMPDLSDVEPVLEFTEKIKRSRRKRRDLVITWRKILTEIRTAESFEDILDIVTARTLFGERRSVLVCV